MDEPGKREIGLYGLTMIAIGSSIGSGIFKTPSDIAGYLPSEGLMLFAWLLVCHRRVVQELNFETPIVGEEAECGVLRDLV